MKSTSTILCNTLPPLYQPIIHQPTRYTNINLPTQCTSIHQRTPNLHSVFTTLLEPSLCTTLPPTVHPIRLTILNLSIQQLLSTTPHSHTPRHSLMHHLNHTTIHRLPPRYNLTLLLNLLPLHHPIFLHNQFSTIHSTSMRPMKAETRTNLRTIALAQRPLPPLPPSIPLLRLSRYLPLPSLPAH